MMTVFSCEETRTEIIRSMLLSAPKERRLDLAVGALLYTPQKQYIQVVHGQTTQIVPVWYFFDPDQQRRVFYYLPGTWDWTSQNQPGQRTPDPVPASTRNPAAAQGLRAWIETTTGAYTLSCGSELCVTLTRGSDGATAMSVSAPRDPQQETSVQLRTGGYGDHLIFRSLAEGGNV